MVVNLSYSLIWARWTIHPCTEKFQQSSTTYPMAKRWALCKIHRGESKGATSSPPSSVSSGPLDSPRWIYTGLTSWPWDKVFILHYIHMYSQKKIQFKSSNSFLGNCLFIHWGEELGWPPLSVYWPPWLVAMQCSFRGFVATPPKVNKSRAHLLSRWARLELTSLAFGELSSEFNSLNRQPIKKLESARCRINFWTNLPNRHFCIFLNSKPWWFYHCRSSIVISTTDCFVCHLHHSGDNYYYSEWDAHFTEGQFRSWKYLNMGSQVLSQNWSFENRMGAFHEVSISFFCIFFSS